jgi:purine-nucleoside phosphorylase
MLTDHLNLIGCNPLRGPNDDAVGPRFPDLSVVYSAHLQTVAAKEAAHANIPLKAGVYACLPGPSYETPAEIRMLRTLGADVVGMSTVPEVIVAKHAGMDVLAFAIVANAAAGLSETPITHAEVLHAVSKAGPKLSALIARVIATIGTAQ